MTLQVTVNGEEHQVPEGSILDLIHFFKLDKKWCIAEQNGQALSRDDYENSALNEGDSIELIRAVAGG
jgi:thiamine biosynthesis protein ThiS